MIHPSLEGRPILIVANKADECGSIPSAELTRTIKNWFADKLTRLDDDAEEPAQVAGKQGGNVFADDDEAFKPPAAAGSTLNDREYEWDVLCSSAIDG